MASSLAQAATSGSSVSKMTCWRCEASTSSSRRAGFIDESNWTNGSSRTSGKLSSDAPSRRASASRTTSSSASTVPSVVVDVASAEGFSVRARTRAAETMSSRWSSAHATGTSPAMLLPGIDGFAVRL
jgi:hypothetical protein